MNKETIAAIATALSESGIGIIRVSGDDAIDIVNRIFVSKKKNFQLTDAKTHTIHYGHIVDGKILNDKEIDAKKVDDKEIDSEKIYDKKVLDEVLVSVMKGPRSYTGEDVVEINCHGGVFIMQKILELVIRNGARCAEPGEFTKRAFLNGRIDLSEAEAVMDLIQSQNDFALEASVNQLRGSVSSVIKEMRSKIIYEIAFIESALDDPENYDTEGYGEKLYSVVEDIKSQIHDLILKSDNGKMLKEGIKTVILGKPNAGKSSFLNRLVGEEKAIVTNIAGTTRDTLEENIRLNGISLQLIDTAGIRETEDIVEKIGVDKARKYAAEADLILYIVDASVPLNESDEAILEMIKDKKNIVLLNKSDLNIVVTEEMIKERLSSANQHIIKISALLDQGIDLFENTIKEMFFQGDLTFNNQVFITNVRHKESLMDAENSLNMVLQSIENGMSEDFYSIDLMNCYSSLGKIIGEEVDDDLVNEIFEKFCMGK
ncbi:MAG: tRNA uridine-5-carboxymethylaminomethyl(34) synthesis GTPase MnmE [Lachnospiraceae bacterium]